MATSPPVRTIPPAQPPRTKDQPAVAVENPELALVPSTPTAETIERTEFSPRILRLPVELDVAIPVRGFRVRNLLALVPGELIESQWSGGKDLPLAAGDVKLAWAEFEVVEARLAARITRVA